MLRKATNAPTIFLVDKNTRNRAITSIVVMFLVEAPVNNISISATLDFTT